MSPLTQTLATLAVIGTFTSGAVAEPPITAAPGTPLHDSANLDSKVAQLLAQMTEEEKILQLLSYCSNGVPRLGIPNLQAGEALHGVVTGAGGATCFPQSISLAATFDPEAVEEMGRVIGQEARAVGMHQVFAPMLGLARDPRWGRVEESYGEDPFLASRMGVAYIRGAQGIGAERFGPDKVIATPKHFVADGEPWGGHNGESFDISERILREVFFAPFEAAVKEAQTGSIMPAHHALNGIPCHANTWLLGDVLRKDWGFAGFVTSDMGDIEKVRGGHKFGIDGENEAAINCLNAGVDMELIGSIYKNLGNFVKQGRLEQATIDRSAARVLRMKIQLLGLSQPNSAETFANGNETSKEIIGYKGPEDIWAKLIADGKFDTPQSAHRPDADKVLHDPAHDALALKLAREAIVLLKNEHALLPLDKAKLKKVLIVGPIAKISNVGGYSGGGSHPYINPVDEIKAVAGSGVNVGYEPGCDTEMSSEALLPKAIAAAADADVIIAVVGHTSRHARENLDRDDLNMPGDQQKLVEAMKKTGKPLVVVLENGAPLSVPWIKENIDAIVESWYGGQNAGRAIADVLFGEVNPGGRMPVTTPKNVGQIPCYYNHFPITGPSDYYQSKWEIVFPFGGGLSYTTFQYGDLVVEPKMLSKDRPATVSVTVANTGTREGDEVVQFYVRQDFTSVERPVQQLVGFKRITLQPGAKKTVQFEVGFEQLKFWKGNGWTMEPGEAQLQIGASSADIRQKGAVAIQ